MHSEPSKLKPQEVDVLLAESADDVVERLTCQWNLQRAGTNDSTADLWCRIRKALLDIRPTVAMLHSVYPDRFFEHSHDRPLSLYDDGDDQAQGTTSTNRNHRSPYDRVLELARVAEDQYSTSIGMTALCARLASVATTSFVWATDLDTLWIDEALEMVLEPVDDDIAMDQEARLVKTKVCRAMNCAPPISTDAPESALVDLDLVLTRLAYLVPRQKPASQYFVACKGKALVLVHIDSSTAAALLSSGHVEMLDFSETATDQQLKTAYDQFKIGSLNFERLVGTIVMNPWKVEPTGVFCSRQLDGDRADGLVLRLKRGGFAMRRYIATST